MKKLFVLILTLALSACSMTGVTRRTTTATEKPAATEAATATTAPTEAPTVEPGAGATVEAN